MKKILLAIAILIANAAFTSCTDLDENLDNEPITSESFATDGEDGQDPDDDDDDSISGGN